MCLGVPGQIVAIPDPAATHAEVHVDGVGRQVSLALLGPGGARVGDWVVVHVGFAMEVIDEAEARATLEEMQRLDDMYESALSDAAVTDEGGDPRRG
jgi:hydrogenase expression/formation protein HypC